MIPEALKIRFPVPKETLESWSEILDDIVKAALLAIPAMLWFGDHSFWLRLFAFIGLILVVYLGAWLANFLRVKKTGWTIREEIDHA